MSDFESFYRDLLDEIPVPLRRKARRAFVSVIVSAEPLNLKELGYFVAMTARRNGTGVVDSDEAAVYEENVEKICGYLLNMDRDATGAYDPVNFYHHSVKEIFETLAVEDCNVSTPTGFHLSIPEAYTSILLKCLRVFQIEADRTHLSLIIRTLQRQVQKYDLEGSNLYSTIVRSTSKTPCLRYTTNHWVTHYARPEKSDEVDNAVVSFLNSPCSKLHYETATFLSPLVNDSNILVRPKVHEIATPLVHLLIKGIFHDWLEN